MADTQQPSSTDGKKKAGVVEPSPQELTVKYCTAFACSDKCPEKIKPYLLQAAPFLGMAVKCFIIAGEYVQIVYEHLVKFYELIKPYQPELLIPSFAGLIMCFFGGSFLTFIAAVEAFKMSGYETTMECARTLMEDLKKVKDANKKDDQIDEDGDGVSDTLQISHEELIKRKTLLFLRVLDPHRLTTAVAGLTAGFLSVIAALKIQFAKTIALGNAIGEAIEPPVISYFLPLFEMAFPVEYKKWAKSIVVYSVRSFAISIAWTVQRIISAFHSAIRGGLLFSRNMLVYLSARNIVHINHEETYLDEIVGYAFAAAGLWFQLSTAFTLPFPLNILLLPFTIAEYLLIWAIHSIN